MAKDPDERYATTVALARAAQDAITTPIPRPAPAVALQPPTEPAPVPASPPTVVGVSASAPTQQRQPHEVPTLRAPDRPPPAPAPSTRPRWRRRSVVISAGVVLTVVAVIVGVTLAVAGNHRGPTSNAPTGPTQTVLPFTGLNGPNDVAVDTAGNVYVAEVATPGGEAGGRGRPRPCCTGLSLPRGVAVVPFTGLSDPDGVAVDTAGSVTSPKTSATGGEAGARVGCHRAGTLIDCVAGPIPGVRPVRNPPAPSSGCRRVCP